MSYLIAASRADLHEKCIGSACLPRSSRETEAMALGTAVHAFLERASKEGVEKALEAVEDETVRLVCERINPDRIPFLAEGLAEICFGYDPETDDAAWAEDGKAIWWDKDEVTGFPVIGKADLAVQGETVYVADYKVGYSEPVQAKDSRQLRYLCLMAAKAWGATSATGEIHHINPGTGWVTTTTVNLTELDLDLARSELRALVAKVKRGQELVAKGTPESLLKVGSWCDRCGSLPYCPAQANLVRIVAGTPEAVADKVLALLTPETAGVAYERWKAMKAALNRVGDALHSYASHSDIPLEGGKVFGARVVKGNRQLDGMKAYRILEAEHGKEVAQAACEVSTSKAAIERALKGQVTPLAPAVRTIMEKLEADGGVTRKETVKIEEFTR